MMKRSIFAVSLLAALMPLGGSSGPLPALPTGAKLAFEEDWSSGKIDQSRWYALRKKWGAGNNGVVPENLAVSQDTFSGRRQNVLVCRAHGDHYEGPVVGYDGGRTRVGGVLVSKARFASGRFEVWLKIGSPSGQTKTMLPVGAVPAIWTYGHRAVRVPIDSADQFVPGMPLYNPHLKSYGTGLNEYWSEIDFPELGKNGDFTHGLYNTFCQNRHDWQSRPIPPIADGRYHCYVTEWRTTLRPLPDVSDAQVREYGGFWWVCDPAVPFGSYLGNPLQREGRDQYRVYAGEKARHWIDGKEVGENLKHVPCMAAQLNLGVWLPEWAGPAPWESCEVYFGPIRIWQYDDPGDVRGILYEDISSNFDARGHPR